MRQSYPHTALNCRLSKHIRDLSLPTWGRRRCRSWQEVLKDRPLQCDLRGADFALLVAAHSGGGGHVIPMHCTGETFTDIVQQQMQGKLIRSYTGSRFTFGT
jgi:hypothetical protein